ncbi:MAG: signal recognition particle receptor subunit alpha [archaeon]
MLNSFGDNIRRAVGRITGAAIVDKKVLEDTIRDIQRALISSDVSVQLVMELSDRIRERTSKEKVPGSISKRQFIVKIVYEELTSLLGMAKKPPLDKTRVLLVGLYGSGKTTTAGKIAKYYQKKGLKPALISTDTWRPAAYEQLRQLGKKINIPALGNPAEKNPVKILKEALKASSGQDIIIVDSAGRDSVDKELIAEIKSIEKELKPTEKWLVLSGDIGQKAGDVADTFNNLIGLTGVVMTKLEGTAKGGGALSAVAHARVPIVFIGVGEKLDDLQEFDANRFLQRIVGMGDLQSLMEKAQEIQAEEEFNFEDILTEKYTLSVFYKQLQAQKKMGSLTDILNMMGMSNKLPKEIVQMSEQRMKNYKYIMDSMTKQELEDPDIISASRIERIAKGSGTKTSEVKQLIADFNRSKKFVNMIKKGKLPRGLKRMMGGLEKQAKA